MIINKRKWLSESSMEAILYIGDQNTICAAFSHPCTFQEGELLIEPLLAINVSGLIRVDSDTFPVIQQKNDSFIHDITGKILDRNGRLIKSGSVIIELENNIPNDIHDGEMVHFSCSRIDVIR